MNDSRFTVNHVRLVTDKPFEDVAKAFEQQLGHFDPDVYKSLAASGDTEGVRAKTEAMAGPSGFMLFGTSDHGALLGLAGQKRKAIQYVVGNPVFALEMTQYDIRASLYAPLRVLIVAVLRPMVMPGIVMFGMDRPTPAAHVAVKRPTPQLSIA